MPFDAPSQDEFLTPDEAHDLHVLREIGQRLRQPGTWIVGRLHGSNGKHCAVGWLHALTSEADSRRIAETYLVPALPWLHRKCWGRGRYIDPEHTIWLYNDMTSQRQVAALFERAASRLERSIQKRAIPMQLVLNC